MIHESDTKSTWLNGRLEVKVGDITHHPADAIVNAASHFLLGSDGCSRAILAAGGPDLVQECTALGNCEEGDAKLSGAYLLPARHVIHTVAPIWRRGYDGEEARLSSCYQRCFELAESQGCRTIAFPSLGTGGHGCPGDWSAQIAVREITTALEQYPTIERVTIVCFDRAIYECYLSVLQGSIDATDDGK